LNKKGKKRIMKKGLKKQELGGGFGREGKGKFERFENGNPASWRN